MLSTSRQSSTVLCDTSNERMMSAAAVNSIQRNSSHQLFLARLPHGGRIGQVQQQQQQLQSQPDKTAWANFFSWPSLKPPTIENKPSPAKSGVLVEDDLTLSSLDRELNVSCIIPLGSSSFITALNCATGALKQQASTGRHH